MMKKRTIHILLGILFPVFIAGIVLAQDPPRESNQDCSGPIYKGSEVSKKAKITFSPPPKTSDDRKASGVRGMVVLKAVLCGSGKVTNIEAIKTLPYGITDKVIEAVQRVRFIPAEKDGQKVSQHMFFEYNFEDYPI